MNGPVLKKPKIKIVIDEEEEDANKMEEEVNDENEQVRKDQEEALIALIEHRTNVVQKLLTRLAYYKSQLEEAEKLLEDAHLKLARSRSWKSISREQVRDGSLSLINQPKLMVLGETDTLSKNTDGLEGRLASIRTTNNLFGLSIKEIKLTKDLPSLARVHESTPANINHSKPHSAPEAVNSSRNSEGVGSESSIKEIKLEKGLSSLARVHESTPAKLNHLKPYSAPEAVNSSRNSEGVGSVSASPSEHGKSFSQNQPRSKSQLIIPGMNPNLPVKTCDYKSGASAPNPQSSIPSSFHGSGLVKQEADLPHRKSPQQEAFESRAKGMKRKLEIKEQKELIKELIPCISTEPSPTTVCFRTSSLINSQHKRRLRRLELCPTNDQLFATSALDGVVNLWQIQGKGSSVNILSTNDCASAKVRRWPEDIAWHPRGSSVFSVYTADGGDTQLSILHLNKKKEKKRVISLEEKPHTKGIINKIMFMPWEDTCFVTGGSDHAVVLWSENGEKSWKPKVLHGNFHSSAVMGVAGMQQKKLVLSAGADKRIFGFDLTSGKTEYKLMIETKCMSILPNPCDFNLFMVQTGTPERQLRLCDIRSNHTELHYFGWKQESSETQSSLVSQAWSPDGLYITSGSADPMIHIFDIRYNAHIPSQSIKAHQKRVFKAVWHSTLPLMISISSDLNIGLHEFKD